MPARSLQSGKQRRDAQIKMHNGERERPVDTFVARGRRKYPRGVSRGYHSNGCHMHTLRGDLNSCDDNSGKKLQYASSRHATNHPLLGCCWKA